MKIHKLPAKSISYDSKKRKRKDVKYIVIHYTGNNGDTAKNNATYFSKSNTREAGAHFFVGKKGAIYKSINMNRTAWAVGGLYTQKMKQVLTMESVQTTIASVLNFVIVLKPIP